MATIKFELSQTVEVDGKKKREKLDDLQVYCPTLKEFGIDVEPTSIDEKTGEAVYEGNAASWLYSAIVQAVKTAARNKFQPQTATLRVGAKIAENLEELVAPAVSNKGAALADRRALLDMFKQWLAAKGLAEAAVKLLYNMLDKPESVLMFDPAKQEKIQAQFIAFGEANNDRLTDWQAAYLSNAIETCSGQELDF